MKKLKLLYMLICISIGCDIEESSEYPEDNRSTEVDLENEMSTNNSIPNPHYVLWDKFGNPIKSIVSPYEKEIIDDLFNETLQSVECVFVQFLNQKSIMLYFNLMTGNPEDCVDIGAYKSIDPFNFRKDYAFYLDSLCSGNMYNMNTGILIFIKDENTSFKQFMYTEGTDVVSDIYYRWIPSTGECRGYKNIENYTFHMFKVVPKDILKSLPDYPYKITLEY